MEYTKRFLIGLLILICATSSSIGASGSGAKGDLKATKSAFDKQRIPETNPSYSFSPKSLKYYGLTSKVKSKDGFVTLPKVGEAAFIVKDVNPGKYYLGVYLSVWRHIGSYGPSKTVLFHNGRKILFAETGALIKLGKSFVTEFLSEKSVPIKNGDELRLSNSLKKRLVGCLNLYSTKPKHGILGIAKGVVNDPFVDDFFRPSVKLSPPKEFDKKAKGEFSIYNALPQKQTLNLNLKVKDYFMATVFELKKKIVIDGKKTFTEKFEYPWGKSDRYMATLDVSNEEENREQAWDQVLTDSRSKFRNKVWLNKNWFLKPVSNTYTVEQSQSEGGEWEKVNLPSEIERKHNKAHVFWYKKEFKIPEWMKNSKRFFLSFTLVGYDAQIWLNGKKIHYQYDPNSPCRLEITKHIDKNSENKIEVACRDSVASLDPNELKGKSIKISRYTKVIAPGGKTGIAETYIEGLPESYIGDARILTSYRKKEVKVAYELEDLQNKKYVLDSTIYFDGKKVFTFAQSNVPSKSGNKKVNIKVSGNWENPVLWSPWTPNLLQLKTELKTETGKTVDIKNTRFGFREFWAEGIAYFINGIRMKVGSLSMADVSSRKNYRNYIKLGKRIELIGKTHMNPGPMMQDINDEEGIVSFLEITSIDHRTHQKFECDEYWKNAEDWASASIKAYWNNPSVMVWFLANEFARQNKMAVRRLQKLGDAAKKLDPSRLIGFGCDIDLEGWNDHISTYYPTDYMGVKSNENFLPDSALWYPVGTELKKGMKLPCGIIKKVINIPEQTPITWGHKPIFINETGWKLHFIPPHGFASVVGDWAYRGVAEAQEAHVAVNRWFLSRHRDVEPVLINPWLWCAHDPMTRTIPQIDIIPLEVYSRWYSGEKVPFKINLHYDKPNSIKMSFSYKIIDLENGDILCEESESLDFKPAELKRKRISIEMPEVSEDKHVNLVFQFTDSNGEVLREEIVDAKIFAKENRFFSDEGILLFDPTGKSAALLKGAGVAFKRIETLTSEILNNGKILIIGRNAAQNKRVKDASKIIEDFVKSGGTVLILNQSKGRITWTPVPLRVVADKKTSITFKRAPNHELFKKLDDNDMKFWYPKHLVSQGDYKKPSKGNFIPLLDSGTAPGGMEYCPMIEMPWGKGCYLASQIEFNAGDDETLIKAKEHPSWFARLFGSDMPDDNSNYRKNPIAEKLLYNILDYLEDYHRKTRALGVVMKAGSDFDKKLNSLGLEFKIATAVNLNDFAVIAVEANALDEQMAKKLRAYAEKGETVLLHKVNIENKKFANIICGGKLRLVDGFHKSFTGRLIKTSNAKILDGLGNSDLFWKQLPITQSYEASYSSPSWAKELIIEKPIDLVDGKVYTFPGAIGELKIGDGLVIVDQINWETTNSAVIRESDRIASVIFTQLACPIKKPGFIEIPKDLKYSPVDISKFLNRSLTDQVDNDGKGGWTDQGPERDFRKLRPGMKKYNGVPFKVEKDKSCLVLVSKYRRPTVPEQVLDIPVGKKADVVFFLQASAWTKKKVGIYRINYENGESYDIELTAAVNMRDWSKKNPFKAFYNEKDTVTTRAFTFSSLVFPRKRTIYMMAWINPKPELKIKSFDFISAKVGVPILLSVTLGRIRRVAADITIVKGDRQKALELFEKAQKSFKEKRDKKAKQLLLAAIKADNSCEEAHARLGRFYRDKGELRKAEKQFRITLAINEGNLDIYLMLGEILERQKRYRDAYRTYQKSFNVDDNQPRIHKAMKQLHKILEKKKKKR